MDSVYYNQMALSSALICPHLVNNLAWWSSLHKANWHRQADGQAQVSIGMHAHPKMLHSFANFSWLNKVQ